MDNTEGILYIFSRIHPKNDYYYNVKHALEDLILPTLNESGCHLFTVFENTEKTEILHTFGIFENESALQQHFEEEYVKHALLQLDEWLLTPTEIIKMRASSSKAAAQFESIMSMPIRFT